MKNRRRWLFALAMVAALTMSALVVASGGGIAQDAAEQQAIDAALAAVPGEFLEVEPEDNGSDGFEVEIRTADGTEIEVHVDLDGNVVSQGPDDHDTGGDDKDGNEGG